MKKFPSLFLLVTLATTAVGAQNVARNVTPAEFATMSKAERQAAAQELKAADAASASAFTGTLAVGGTHPYAPETVNISITYDTGTFSGVGDIPAIADNFSFGNNFDTVNGGTIGGGKATVTVTQLTAFMALVDGSSTGTGGAFATIFGPPSTAGIAPSLTSANFAGLQGGTFNMIPIGTTLTGTLEFMAGIWNSTNGSTAGTTPCAVDCVGFDSGTVGGQGFHGMAIEDFGGGNFTPNPSANAMLRASGALVPVELMNFSID
ncbi:MAG: hypothetical protein K8J08_20600 [Thermoanaerobaculia bacterium]|nr:hypothetical protein [Thermoanaerobaculia bacterium]